MGRGRRVPIAPLIRAQARELDVELRELSEEAEVDEVEFVPTQFSGENEEQSKKNRKSMTRASSSTKSSHHGRNARVHGRPGSWFPLSRSLSASAARAAMQRNYVR